MPASTSVFMSERSFRPRFTASFFMLCSSSTMRLARTLESELRRIPRSSRVEGSLR